MGGDETETILIKMQLESDESTLKIASRTNITDIRLIPL